MRHAFLTTAALIALMACSRGEPAAVSADLAPDRVVEIVAERPDGDLAPQSAYEALIAELPGGVAVTVGGYEPEGAGVVARDVLVASEAGGAAVRIDALRAYDLSAGALTVLSAGPGEEAALASRLDMQGVTVTGLEAMTGALSEAMLGEVAAMAGPDALTVDQSVDEYDYAIGRLVLDDAVLYSPLAEPGGDAGPAQRLARFAGVFGAAYGLASDVSAAVAVTQAVASAAGGGEAPVRTETRTTIGMDQLGLAGWHGSDVAMEFVRGFRVDTQQASDVADGGMSSGQVGEEIVLREFSLNGVLPYLVAGEFPSAGETDILSFGRWEVSGYSTLLGGEVVSTVERMEADLTAFHGLLPETLTYSSSETVRPIGIVAMIREQVGEMAQGRGGAPADLAQLDALARTLTAAGLDTVSMRNEGSYRWSPDTGETVLDITSRGEDLGGFAMAASLLMPTHEQFVATPPAAGEPTANPLRALLAEEAALSRFELTLTDQGGLDQLLAVAIAVTEGSEEPGLAMLQGQDPASLRQMIAGLVAMGSAQMGAAIPQVRAYGPALQGWLQEGGTLRLVLEPEVPLDAAGLAELQALQADPGALIERLGLAVTHEADPSGD